MKTSEFKEVKKKRLRKGKKKVLGSQKRENFRKKIFQ